MKKYLLTLVLSITFILPVFCQKDSTKISPEVKLFMTIMQDMEQYVPDTSAAPNDKITTKIQAIRQLRGGFNINEVVLFKLEESRQKNELNTQTYNRIKAFFKTGNGKRWLDNAVIHIYRKRFTYAELKTLEKFYRTPAGQKMATELPLIMVESLKAAEMIQKLAK